MNKKTVVLGASENPSRYSNMAVKKLAAHNHAVVAVGRRAGSISGVEITKEKPDETDVDTVTLYLNPENQKPYYNYILSLHPNRIIFNPGTENKELYDLAKANGIAVVEACTLVLLATDQY